MQNEAEKQSSMAEKSEIIDIDPTSTISDELLLHLVESQELVTEIILEREMIEEQENVSEEEDVQLQFIPDPEHTVVMGEQPAPSAEKKSTKKPKVYNCQKCKKKYATESRYNKHVNECKGLNAKSKKKGKKITWHWLLLTFFSIHSNFCRLSNLKF